MRALGIWDDVAYIRKPGSNREVDICGKDPFLEWESRYVHAFPPPEDVNAGVSARPSAVVCICFFVFSTVNDCGLGFAGMTWSGT